MSKGYIKRMDDWIPCNGFAPKYKLCTQCGVTRTKHISGICAKCAKRSSRKRYTPIVYDMTTPLLMVHPQVKEWARSYRMTPSGTLIDTEFEDMLKRRSRLLATWRERDAKLAEIIPDDE